jgi:prephenate dehydrogenase
VEALGAHPLWLDAHTHDRWAAATSHLPYLLSVALALATPLETAPLVGPGFQSTSRLASSSPTMMADILHTNRENTLQALDRFRTQLDALEAALRDMDDAAMTSTLTQAIEARRLLLSEERQ